MCVLSFPNLLTTQYIALHIAFYDQKLCIILGSIAYLSPICDFQEQIAKEAGHRAELLDTWVWLQVSFYQKKHCFTIILESQFCLVKDAPGKPNLHTVFVGLWQLKNVCKQTQQIWEGGGLR